MRRGLTPSEFAVGGALVSLALSAPWLLSSSAGASLDEMFTPELVALYQMYDSAGQRRAHQTALALVAVLSVIGMALARRDRCRALGERVPAIKRALHRLTRGGGFVAVVALGALFAELPVASALTPTSPIVEPTTARAVSLAFALVMIEGLSRATPSLDTPRARALLWIAVVGYVLTMLVPGFTLPLDLSRRSPELIAAVESHFSFSVIGSAARLAAGIPFEDVHFYYGALSPTLLAILERFLGAPDFATEVRGVQAAQLLFVALAGFAHAAWRPRSPLCALVAMLLFVPYVSNFNLQAWFPNQSGARFLTFPLGALALLWLRRCDAGTRTAALLGAGSALSMLWNFETGIAISAAFALFLGSRLQPLRVRSVAVIVGSFLGAAVAVTASFLCIFRVAFGSWPIPDSLGVMFTNISHALRGIAGRPLVFDPIAFLLLGHAAYTIIRSAMRWRAGRLGADGSFQAAIAAAILIWFAYYANRPHPLNIWSLLFLYGFLVVDLLDRRVLALRCHRPLARVALPGRTALLAFIVLPAIFQSNWQAFELAGEVLARAAAEPPAASGARRISGVWLDADAASVIERRAEYLRAWPADEVPLYFSTNVYFLPHLTGRFLPLTIQDAFTETLTPDDFERLVTHAVDLAPQRILFDGDDRLAGPVQQGIFFARLQSHLARLYRPSGQTHGWQIWERRAAH